MLRLFPFSPSFDDVLNSDLWVSAICDNAYFEYVLRDKVPTMYSNTEPSGECFSDSIYNNFQPWKAFDNDDSTSAFCNVSETQTYWYIGYELTAPLNLYKVKVVVGQSTSTRHDNYTYKIQYFDNIINDWVDCSEEFLYTPSDSGILTTNIATNGILSTKFRVYGLRAKTNAVKPYEPPTIFTIQFYGRSQK